MLNWNSAKNQTNISISPSIVVFTVFFLGLLYFLFLIKDILMLLFLAFILMVALNPAAKRFQQTLRLPRGLSIGLAYILFFFLVVAVTALVLPPLTLEIVRLIKTIDLPYLQDQLGGVLTLSNFEIGSLVNQFNSSFNFLVGAVTNTFNSIFTFITLLIMSVFLALEQPDLHKKVSWFSKDKKHLKQAEQFLKDLESHLGGWVRGEVILMASIALMTYFGLTLLNIPFALPLAILAGILESLPGLGPFLSAVPAVAIAYLYFGTNTALAMVALYTVIQQLENNFLVPRIMRVNAHVNPLVSIVAILTGLKLAGIGGALLAIPAYITLRAIYSHLRQHL